MTRKQAAFLTLCVFVALAWPLGSWSYPSVELTEDLESASRQPRWDQDGAKSAARPTDPSPEQGDDQGPSPVKTRSAGPSPRIALPTLFDDPGLPWSDYPRTRRDFPPWVMQESETIRAGILFRHVQLNAGDRPLTVPARERLDLTVRNHLQVLARLRRLWTDSVARELSEGVKQGTAFRFGPQPASTRTREAAKGKTKRSGHALPASRRHRELPTYVFPTECMVPGVVVSVSLDGASPATWSHLKSMPVSAELQRLRQQASFSLGKAILDFFSSKTLLTKRGHEALLKRMLELLRVTVR